MSIDFEIYKAERKRRASGATVAGAGVTTAGVGVLAGGNPRKKHVSLEGINFNEKPTSARQLVTDKAKVVSRMGSGGILGFRTSAHEGGLYEFKQKATKDAWSGRPKDTTTAFRHGRNAGKIHPEEQVIRHMRGGRKAAHLAVAGGLGAIAVGANRHRKEVSKRRKETNDALIGAGTAGGAISGGGGALLSSQRRRWGKVARENVNEGAKLAPNTAGLRRKRVLAGTSIDPSVTDGAIARNKLLKGVPMEVARKVGEHRGAAAQARHFSHVYGNTGKVVAIGGGVASAAAIHSGLKGRKKVQKSMTMSAFGVDHG